MRSPSSGTDVHLPLPLPFADLSAYAIALVYVAYFFGYYIRGSFGFGSNLPAVLITAWVFDPQHTVRVVAVVAGLAVISRFCLKIRTSKRILRASKAEAEALRQLPFSESFLF